MDGMIGASAAYTKSGVKWNSTAVIRHGCGFSLSVCSTLFLLLTLFNNAARRLSDGKQNNSVA